jgi:hypothetical protein
MSKLGFSSAALALSALCVFAIHTSSAFAAVTVVDKDDWKFLIGGFAEMDTVHDSTRSLTEVVGNTPIDRPGTFAGDNGRTQFSTRNSRLAFTILPPVQDDWKSKGYLEFDLLGYDPTPAAGTNSEASFFSNATLRVRHAYLNAESSGWSILAGQTWSLFGWQPYYVISTVAPSPGPGVLYQRTPQVTASKLIEFSDENKLQTALSMARPSQRDGEIPNFDAGLRLLLGGRRSGFASATSEVTAEPMSVAVSGSYRQFTTANGTTSAAGTSHSSGSAGAVSILLPLLTTSDGKDASNTLTLTGEFTEGRGYADEFSGLSGNLSQMPNGAGASGSTNLDGGLGGFDSSQSFQLINLQSANAQLQYHFASSAHIFATLGYSQVQLFNIAGLSPVTANKTLYDKTQMMFFNVFHDFTKQIRIAAEYEDLHTRYVDGVTAQDRRYQVSGYFRF